MGAGPIEFMGEMPEQHVPDTEYGGADGLIQPEFPADAGGATGLEGHTLDPAEAGNVIARRAAVPLTRHEGWTGEVDGDEIVDPVTGRVVPEDMLSGDVTGDGGTLSDLKP